MNQPKILVVEDEIGIANFIQQGLQEEGMDTSTCSSGEEALLLINKVYFDLILLDWMILNMSGLDVCKAIRNTANINMKTPIIFITAKDTVQDTITGLNAGADDYIKKPFNFDELVARINVHLRQNHNNHLVEIGDIAIDTSANEVFRQQHLIDLTPKEFQLLHYLFAHKNRICTRKEIIEKIWDIHFDYDTSVIEVFVNSIRKKLNLKKDDPRLHTIRGVGYMTKDVQ